MGSLKTVAGLRLWVEDSGEQANSKGTVLLLHSFPDTSSLWKQQISALNAAGYRTIAPDLPGLGRSEAPGDVSKYSIQSSIAPAMLALLDELSVDKVTVVGHDFGSGVAMTLAFMAPARVERLVVLSVGSTGSYFTAQPWEQRTVSWYMPFILLKGSDDALRSSDWAMFRLFVGRDGSEEQVNEYIERLKEPGALEAALNYYRGNVSVEMLAAAEPIIPPFKLPMPVLGVHPEGDSYCLEAQMSATQAVVEEGRWRFERVPGGHWASVQDPGALNKLLLDFLASN